MGLPSCARLAKTLRCWAAFIIWEFGYAVESAHVAQGFRSVLVLAATEHLCSLRSR